MNDNTLSVFVDESGILNESDASSRYYIIAFVLHDQSMTSRSQYLHLIVT